MYLLFFIREKVFAWEINLSLMSNNTGVNTCHQDLSIFCRNIEYPQLEGNCNDLRVYICPRALSKHLNSSKLGAIWLLSWGGDCCLIIWEVLDWVGSYQLFVIHRDTDTCHGQICISVNWTVIVLGMILNPHADQWTKQRDEVFWVVPQCTSLGKQIILPTL